MVGLHFATTANGAEEAVELKKQHADWLDTRGIDPELATKFGLHTVQSGGRHWLAVPYSENGKVVNHKYRVTSEAHAYRMDEDAPLTLWNADILLDQSLASQPLIVTEGEWDALTIITAGKRRVVSVPNGAPRKSSDDQELEQGNRYAWFWRLEPLLRDVREVILCVDRDEAGQALAADLCRLFGPECCLFVQYPEGCKDAGDVAKLHDHQTLVRMLDAAKPYPIKGLFRLSEFPDMPELPEIAIGIPGLGGLINIVPQSLTVLTGYPGQGKTSLSMAIVANLLKQHVPVCLGTFETLPRPILQRRLRAAILNCGEFASIPIPEIRQADELMERYLSVIAQMVGEDDEMTLEDVLDRARVAVLRDNARVLILDPWNEIEHKRRGEESETEYVGRALRAIKTFMRQYQVAVWLVAHPAKPHEGNAAKVPGLLHISGSMNWANKPDYGVTCTRPNKETNEAVVYVTKVRMGYPGKEGQVRLAYDFRTSSYSEVTTPQKDMAA